MISAGSPTEFVDAFAFPLPGETVFRFIGFPEGDDELLKSWCSDRKAFSWGQPTDEQQAELAEHMLAYWRYCRDFTADKRKHRGDDLAVGDRAPGDVDPVAPEPVRAEPGERRSVERAGLDDFEMIRGRHAL